MLFFLLIAFMAIKKKKVMDHVNLLVYLSDSAFVFL